MRNGRLPISARGRIFFSSLCRALFVTASAGSWLAGSGCAVHDEEERAIYRAVLDLPPPAERAESDSLSLRDALLTANAYNENLSIEGEGYLRTLIQLRRTAASFYPKVTLTSATIFREDTSSSSDSLSDEDQQSGGRGGEQDSIAADVSADLRYTVFNGLRTIHSYWRDTFRSEQRLHEILASQERFLLDVARIYYQVLRSERSVEVLQSSQLVQEERLRTTAGRRAVGLARVLDVTQTEAQLAQTRTRLIDAARDVQNARALLRLLTGGAVESAVLSDGYRVPEHIEDRSSYLALAKRHRADLKAAALAVEAATHETKVAFGQYYPSVTLDFSSFLSRETVPTERDWEGVLSVSLPIFTGGQIRADVREAWSFVREALLMQAYLERQVEQQIAEAYNDFTASGERLTQLQLRLIAAEQSSRQAEGAYRIGTATNLDRVVAQETLLLAQLDLTSEQFSRKVHYLALLRAAGVLREECSKEEVTL